MRTCTQGAQAEHHYQSGDARRQVARDLRAKIKVKAVGEWVQRERGRGKIRNMKEKVDLVRARWNDGFLVRRLVFWHLVMCIVTAAVSVMVTLPCAWEMHSAEHAWALSTLETASQLGMLLFFEGLVVLGVRIAAAKVRVHSKIIEVFVHDVMTIDLDELGIDLSSDAKVIRRAADRVLVTLITMWIMASGFWLWALQAV